MQVVKQRQIIVNVIKECSLNLAKSWKGSFIFVEIGKNPFKIMPTLSISEKSFKKVFLADTLPPRSPG